jgi:hypothetical protein
MPAGREPTFGVNGRVSYIEPVPFNANMNVQANRDHIASGRVQRMC